MPVAQDGQAAVDVAHRIVREDGVEARVRKRQRTMCVDPLKVGPSGEPAGRSEVFRVGDAVLVDIDAGHVATASLSQIEGRPSGAAAHVEDLTAGPDRGLVSDMQPFFGSHPTALADILAVGLAPDGLFGCARETAVRMIVEVD